MTPPNLLWQLQVLQVGICKYVLKWLYRIWQDNSGKKTRGYGELQTQWMQCVLAYGWIPLLPIPIGSDARSQGSTCKERCTIHVLGRGISHVAAENKEGRQCTSSFFRSQVESNWDFGGVQVQDGIGPDRQNAPRFSRYYEFLSNSYYLIIYQNQKFQNWVEIVKSLKWSQFIAQGEGSCREWHWNPSLPSFGDIGRQLRVVGRATLATVRITSGWEVVHWLSNGSSNGESQAEAHRPTW